MSDQRDIRPRHGDVPRGACPGCGRPAQHRYRFPVVEGGEVDDGMGDPGADDAD